jgi:Fe-S cluster assembly iron-binding protein IscA
MVQVTKEAAQHLVRVRGERGFGRNDGARFLKRGAGVGLTFSKKPEPGDRVIETNGVPVFVAADVAQKLDRGVIDVGDKDGKTALYFKRRVASKQTA